jgi:hypothetical protein
MKEICDELGITEKQLFVRIKQIINYGYLLDFEYSYNSDIRYKFKDNYEISEKSLVSIDVPKDTKQFRCIVISDLHIGAYDSDIRLINIVYEYAIKNEIKVILNCGDNIEGEYTSDRKSIKDLYSQIEYFIKKYPYDKNINNFIILGNHEYHSLYYDGLDMANALKNTRYDIIPIGYGQGNINIQKDNIILYHQICKDFKPHINGEKILLSGHGHMMKTKLRDIFWLGVPTLSYQSNDKTKDVIPGFVDLTIDLENNKFKIACAKHMIITPQIIQVSEVRGKVKNLFKDSK